MAQIVSTGSNIKDYNYELVDTDLDVEIDENERCMADVNR